MAVLAAAIALTIFFGAWAVSTDLEASYGALVTDGEELVRQQPAGADAAGAENEDWWQKTLLFACPFH